MTLLLLLLGSAGAAEPLWPELSEPPAVGGGSLDAAVVVAIEDYVFVGDIPGAKANGLDWYSYLTDGRGISPSRVQLVTDNAATKEGITAAVEKATAAVQAGGTLWFVFIGHGAPSQDGQDGLLVGSDTQQSAVSVYARGLMQSDVLSQLDVGTQAQTVAILDACFSGQSGADTSLVAGLQPMIPSYALSSSSRRTVVLSAGSSKQFAGPLPGVSRPAFSYLALGALWGWGDADADGTVTTGEVHEYALGALSALPIGREQTPAISGAGELGLSPAREAGPQLSAIRRALEGPASPSSAGQPLIDLGGGNGSDFARLAAEAASANQAAEEAERLRAEAEQKRDAAAAALEIERGRRHDEAATALRAQAKSDYAAIAGLLESQTDSSRAVVSRFVEQYADATVTIDGTAKAVDIPEAALAQSWLFTYARFGQGDVWMGDSGYEMVWIDPGSFAMGSPASEAQREPDERHHQVALTEGFYVGTLEVTQEQWVAVMGSNPVEGKRYRGHALSSPDYPAVLISWCDAVVFANALSRRDGLSPAYRLPDGFSESMSDDACTAKSGAVAWDRSADGYRLLTESEWEYTALAGTDHRYAGTSSDMEMCRYGNVLNPSAVLDFQYNWASFPCEDGHQTLAPVGSFEPNAWGIHDMSGNVDEWCWDWYGDYPENASTDPHGPSRGTKRVERGGSWIFVPASVRPASRSAQNPNNSRYTLGIRLARS